MKLFEVMYPECKKCGFDFSKGGRDHRCGVCDVCAFPNSDKAKKARVKEGVQADPLTAKIEELLWSDYQQDDYIGPVGVGTPDELDDEDFLEFGEHVRDVVKFANQRRIRSARQAIDQYTDAIAQQHPYHPTIH